MDQDSSSPSSEGDEDETHDLEESKNLVQNQLDTIFEYYKKKLGHLKKLEIDLAEKENELKNEKIKLEETLKSLSEREEKMVEIEKKLSKSTSVESKLGKNQIVKLNVGGKIFATNLATLKSVKDTFFTGYFNDHFNPQPEEEDNAYFIDRPFKQFHLILDYLRGIDTKHKVENFHESDLIDFIEEVVFYQITPIYELLPKKGRIILKSKYGIIMDGMENVEFDPKYCSTNLKLESPTRIVKMGVDGWDSTILGTKSNHFKIKLIEKCHHVMMGFAPKIICQSASNNSTNVYFLYTKSGKLYSRHGVSHKRYSNCGEIVEGSIVEGEYKDGTITFIVNGINYGVAFSNIPSEPELFPAFTIYDTGCKFEFLNDE